MFFYLEPVNFFQEPAEFIVSIHIENDRERPITHSVFMANSSLLMQLRKHSE